MFLRKLLLKVAEAQAKRGYAILALALLFTAVTAMGIPEIKLQTDLSKELPSGIEEIEKLREIGAKFGSSDSIIVVIRTKGDSKLKNTIQDIRDPRVSRMIKNIHTELEDEPEVGAIYSAYSIYAQTGIPDSLEKAKFLYQNIPQLRDFYSKDLKSTVIYIYADIGADEERNKKLVDRVREAVEGSEVPAGVEFLITGTPPMRLALFQLLIRDALFTISLAGVVILLLLIVLQRSLIKGFLVFLPLTLAVVWTLGTMGLLDIPLSIGTVGIGAMILGLGVEYGIFMIQRYEEERGKSQEKILKTIVPGVGLNITGSATTTMAGFLALLFASMPMVQKMGLTLALGIFYSYIAAVIVNPAIIALADRRGWLD